MNYLPRLTSGEHATRTPGYQRPCCWRSPSCAYVGSQTAHRPQRPRSRHGLEPPWSMARAHRRSWYRRLLF